MSGPVSVHHGMALRAYRKLHTTWNRVTPPFLNTKPRIAPDKHRKQQQRTAICALCDQFVELAREVHNLCQENHKVASPPSWVFEAITQTSRDTNTSAETLKKLARTRRTTMEAYTATEKQLKMLTSEHHRINRRLVDIRAALTMSHVPNPHHSSTHRRKYSVFISHSGEDKNSMAIPLYRMLDERGVRTFLDAAELRPGDNGMDEMEHAMQSANVGIFIISPEFVAKEYPMKELNTFLWRQYNARKEKGAPVTLIPVFYRLDVHQCRHVNNLLRCNTTFGNLLVDHGFVGRVDRGIDSVASLEQRMKAIAACTGIENHEGASNLQSAEMRMKRERLQVRIVEAVLAEPSGCHGI